MNYSKKISDYLQEHKDELISDVMTLIKIDSSYSEPVPGMPFGEGSAKAILLSQEILEKYGFKCTNYDNYVLAADMNDEPKALDILAHVDVVPGGDGWTVTEPYSPIIIDGNIYGRGSSDDKGPAWAAVFAMRAIKDLGIELKGNVRLILGGCEELGLGDLEYYYAREKEAPASFSPDAEFPLINAERGIGGVYFESDFGEPAESDVLYVQAGLRRNMIPGTAAAKVRGVTADEARGIAKEYCTGYGLGYSVSEEEGTVTINIKGLSGHASLPETAKNSLTCLAEIIAALRLEGKAAKAISALSDVFPYGVHHGEAAGVDMEDEKTGRISVSFNILNLENGKMSGALDCRTPLCALKENYNDVIESEIKACGIDSVKVVGSKPHYVPKDSELVRTLLSSYEKVTGKKGYSIAIGGGTYVHELENGVAFGCQEQGVDYHMHGPDEYMDIETLIKSAEIFADAIINICGIK